MLQQLTDAGTSYSQHLSAKHSNLRGMEGGTYLKERQEHLSHRVSKVKTEMTPFLTAGRTKYRALVVIPVPTAGCPSL